tara:strand:+ start:4062 stop:4226 length:165 start_codon:yes stop_codon:yes gene_type:complete
MPFSGTHYTATYDITGAEGSKTDVYATNVDQAKAKVLKAEPTAINIVVTAAPTS